jgi:hypothetical protein
MQKLATFSEAIDYFKRNLVRLETNPKKTQPKPKDHPVSKKPLNYAKLTLSLSPTSQIQSQGSIFTTFQSKVSTPYIKSPKKLPTVPLNKGVLANKVQLSANPRVSAGNNSKTSRSGKIQPVIATNYSEFPKKSLRKSIMVSKETNLDFSSESSLSLKMEPVFGSNSIIECMIEKKKFGDI